MPGRRFRTSKPAAYRLPGKARHLRACLIANGAEKHQAIKSWHIWFERQVAAAARASEKEAERAKRKAEAAQKAEAAKRERAEADVEKMAAKAAKVVSSLAQRAEDCKQKAAEVKQAEARATAVTVGCALTSTRGGVGWGL